MLRIVLYSIGILAGVCRCSSKNIGIHKGDVLKTSMVYKVPSRITSDSIALIADSAILYSYGTYKIYELPSRYSEYVENTLVQDSATSYFIGYDTLRSIGFKASNLQDTLITISRLDSFLKDRPNALAVKQLLPLATLVKAVQPSQKTKTLYYSINNPEIDLLVLSFDQSLLSIPFSYSPQLDSMHASKLRKIEIRLKQDISNDSSQMNKYRTITWEIRKIEPVVNARAIVEFCNRLKAAYNLL